MYFCIVMIFHFSGTGNSLWVAETVAAAFSDKLVAMADFSDGDEITPPVFDVAQDERIGFVFPVHSWGVPWLVRKFIEQLHLNSYTKQLIYGIFTYGDECGYTREMFLGLLENRGFNCRHVYSVQMPNTYIAFPGFDIDGEELQKKKKRNAAILLPMIIDAIRSDAPVEAYKKGSFPFLKSRIIYPLFCKYAMSGKPFRTTCFCTSCGLCEKICPTKNIKIIKRRPVWGNRCTQCLACIHRCPVRAIEYGNRTQNKGRYYFKKESVK